MQTPLQTAALVVAAEVRPDSARLPFTRVLSDGRSVTIHFDNLTHSVRRPRALTQCRLHSLCRRDRFLRRYPTAKRCVAELLAWHETALSFVGADGHKSANIPEAAVDAWEALIG